MCKDNALWSSRRSRSINDVRRIRGCGPAYRIVGRTCRRQGIDIKHRDSGWDFNRATSPAGCYQYLGAAVRKHVGKPFGGKVGIEWNIGAACFVNAQKCDNEHWRAGNAEPDQTAGTDAQRDQSVRYRVCTGIELVVADDFALEGNCRRSRGRGCLRFKQLDENAVLGVRRRI